MATKLGDIPLDGRVLTEADVLKVSQLQNDVGFVPWSRTTAQVTAAENCDVDQQSICEKWFEHIVHIGLWISTKPNTSGEIHVCTLPSGYRPTYPVRCPVGHVSTVDTSGSSYALIGSDGVIKVNNRATMAMIDICFYVP